MIQFAIRRLLSAHPTLLVVTVLVFGMVQLLPEQQENYRTLAPEAFTPAPGAWGRNGSTRIRLAAIGPEMLEAALSAAWERRAAIKPRRR